MTTMPRNVPARRFYGESANHRIWGLLEPAATRRPLRDGERSLGIFILPPFQRDSVWTLTQKARWIESIYMGLPLPALVWNRTTPDNAADEWLLDGQQRMTAILEYVTGAWEVDGWRYPDLPDEDRRHFDRMSIPVVTTDIPDVEMCQDIYRRLAYGGTAHAPAPEMTP